MPKTTIMREENVTVKLADGTTASGRTTWLGIKVFPNGKGFGPVWVDGVLYRCEKMPKRRVLRAIRVVE
jgi:hypothetical protein